MNSALSKCNSKSFYVPILNEIIEYIVKRITDASMVFAIKNKNTKIRNNGRKNSKPLNHNENEIVGYRDSLNEIHLHYEDI